MSSSSGELVSSLANQRKDTLTTPETLNVSASHQQSKHKDKNFFIQSVPESVGYSEAYRAVTTDGVNQTQQTL